MRILAAHVDVALGRARRHARDDHAFDQHERIALHDEAVGEGAGVAFIRIADDVLLVRIRAAHGFPFDAGGECRAAASAQAGIDERFAHRVAVHVEHLAQARKSAERGVIVDGKRVRDTDARERQPLLLLEVRNVVDQADVLRVDAAFVERGIEEGGDTVFFDIRITDAPLRRFHFDERFEIEEAARTVAHDLHVDAALVRFAFDGLRNTFRAQCQRGGIAGNVDARHAVTSVFWLCSLAALYRRSNFCGVTRA